MAHPEPGFSLAVPGATGPEVAGTVRLRWPPQADPAFPRAKLEAVRDAGRLEVSDFRRGAMLSVSRGEARLVGLLHGDDGVARFAGYLRHGMAGTSAPKAGVARVPGFGEVLLAAHRTQGGHIELVVPASRLPAASAPASAHAPSAAAAGAEISKVAGAAAAADAPAEVYAGPDRDLPERVSRQRRRLFEGLPGAAVEAMRLDDVALFSVTAAPAAETMTRMIAQRVGPGAGVIDGTACVGGNTISFARTFPRVVACEVSAQRCELLAHNLRAAAGAEAVVAESTAAVRAAAEASAPVTVFHGGVQDLLRADPAGWPPLGRALFLDPPWGGPEYKRLAKLSLYLGDQGVAALLAEVAERAREQRAAGRGPLSDLSLVALKGPFNLDVEEVLTSSRGLLQLRERKLMERGRVLVLLLAVKPPKRQRAGPEDGAPEAKAGRAPDA